MVNFDWKCLKENQKKVRGDSGKWVYFFYQEEFREINCVNKLSNVYRNYFIQFWVILIENQIVGIKQNFCLGENWEVVMYVEED